MSTKYFLSLCLKILIFLHCFKINVPCSWIKLFAIIPNSIWNKTLQIKQPYTSSWLTKYMKILHFDKNKKREE